MSTTPRPLETSRRIAAARRSVGWLIEAGGAAILLTQLWHIA